MKIDIEMGTKKITGDSCIESKFAPYASVKIDITKEELDSISKRDSQKELFEAITRILNFSVQLMQ